MEPKKQRFTHWFETQPDGTKKRVEMYASDAEIDAAFWASKDRSRANREALEKRARRAWRNMPATIDLNR